MSESAKDVNLVVGGKLGELVEWVVRFAELLVLTGIIKFAAEKTASVLLELIGSALFGCLAIHAWLPVYAIISVPLPRRGWLRFSTIVVVSAASLFVAMKLYEQIAATVTALAKGGIL